MFVIDTSSILQVRRLMSREPNPKVTSVYQQLIRAARSGSIVFPKGIIGELELGSADAARRPDPAADWAIACKGMAVPNEELLIETREVLSVVPDLLDADKPSTTDEADPYVVALALQLIRADHAAVVVTEETRDTPTKTSMRSACGLLRIPTLSMRVFLSRQGYWQEP
ncbi:MAG TPA: DUF4411 family protein [Kofleriaceae bacterium]